MFSVDVVIIVVVLYLVGSLGRMIEFMILVGFIEKEMYYVIMDLGE